MGAKNFVGEGDGQGPDDGTLPNYDDHDDVDDNDSGRESTITSTTASTAPVGIRQAKPQRAFSHAVMATATAAPPSAIDPGKNMDDEGEPGELGEEQADVPSSKKYATAKRLYEQSKKEWNFQYQWHHRGRSRDFANLTQRLAKHARSTATIVGNEAASKLADDLFALSQKLDDRNNFQQQWKTQFSTVANRNLTDVEKTLVGEADPEFLGTLISSSMQELADKLCAKGLGDLREAIQAWCRVAIGNPNPQHISLGLLSACSRLSSQRLAVLALGEKILSSTNADVLSKATGFLDNYLPPISRIQELNPDCPALLPNGFYSRPWLDLVCVRLVGRVHVAVGAAEQRLVCGRELKDQCVELVRNFAKVSNRLQVCFKNIRGTPASQQHAKHSLDQMKQWADEQGKEKDMGTAKNFEVMKNGQGAGCCGRRRL